MPTVVTLTPSPSVDVFTETEEIAPERKMRCSAEVREPGGGGLNVARAMRTLGEDALAVVVVGGPPGEALRAMLTRCHIAHFAVESSAWTRQNLSVRERKTGHLYRFVMPAPPIDLATCETAIDEVTGTVEAPSAVVCSGALPPNAPEDLYARIGAQVKPRGALFVADTSGASLKAVARLGADLLKPNRRELGELTDMPVESEEEIRAAAHRALELGPTRAVLVSLAHAGALLVSRDEEIRVMAPRVEVRSAVGAGDSMVAAATFALVRRQPIAEVARAAVAAGTAAVMTSGTELFRAEDYRSMCERVTTKAAPSARSREERAAT